MPQDAGGRTTAAVCTEPSPSRNAIDALDVGARHSIDTSAVAMRSPSASMVIGTDICSPATHFLSLRCDRRARRAVTVAGGIESCRRRGR